ncbi:MAG: hypothetical protein Q4G40_02615 [Brachybacterium sp.]|nr:hypothetical protein [Brachybacterium sp.]
MQPVPTVPGPPRPVSRRYGLVVTAGAVAWGVLFVLAWILAGSAIYAMLLGVSEVKTPSPDGAARIRNATTVTTVLAVLCVIALVTTLVLDLIAMVQSVRRMVGGPDGAALPAIVLGLIVVTTVVPATIGGLAILASWAEQQEIFMALAWLTGALLIMLAPMGRFTLFTLGIVRAAVGETPVRGGGARTVNGPSAAGDSLPMMRP